MGRTKNMLPGSMVSHEGETDYIELSRIINVATIQSLMDDLYAVTQMGIGIIDLKGNILVKTGWQDICTKFYRVNPETREACIESDNYFSKGVKPGKFFAYKCKNNQWDICTPIMIGNKHVGNIFLGQFFYEDESIDYDFYTAQAEKYGFDKESFINALEHVPRWNKERVNNMIKFYARFAEIVSTLGYDNIKLAKAINDQKKAKEQVIKARDELEVKVKQRTEELARANIQLKQYGLRITQIQEEERKRIAYELHDDTAQYLSILKMEIEALINSGEINSSELLNKLEFLKKDAERAFIDVRRYSHELRPGVLEHLGLQAALEQFIDDFNQLKTIPVELHIEGEEPQVSEDIKLAFFRIAQEALNNARKHSKANRIIIDLKYDHSQIQMVINDNGIGFEKNKASTINGSKGNLGFMSMQERADMINAYFKIESEPGKGTRVILKSKL